ncbi:MAG: NADH:ubiquinone oxidoreductase [Bacteroidetes bacterium GWB2_41_8]|nr:MAG: NADH:ubiquinone oxidoreductase [Bacteroidetes bacterium GWB2_41_8]
MDKEKIIYKDECYAIINACMEVHNHLGEGFLEAVYQEALEYEFELQNIPSIREYPLQIVYKNKILEKGYIPDFICYDKIIVELKAVSELDSSHISQVLNYLKATGFRLGLLINFGESSLKWKRIIK